MILTEPWKPEKAVSPSEAAQLIEKQFPELKPAKVQKLGEGFDNSVFKVNDRYVFRFPRREIAAELIETENRLLPVIAPMLPIPIPNLQFQGTADDSYPWPFSGYPMIDGTSPKQLTEEQRLMSTEPLAHFLRALHSFSVDEAKRLRIPFDNFGRIDLSVRKPRFAENIDKIWEYQLIDADLNQALRKYLHTLPESFKEDIQTLVHGDLHIRNILVDDKGKVSGVIDWGDTHIGHPALDLSIAYSFIPPKGRTRFFQIYGEVDETMQTMARFKAVYTAVLLLLYGHDLEDEDLVKESLTAIRLAMQ